MPCLVATIEILLVAVFGVNGSTDLNDATALSRHDGQTIYDKLRRGVQRFTTGFGLGE